MDIVDELPFAAIAISDHVTPVTQTMLRDHTGQLIQIDIETCGLWVDRFACWGDLFDTA